MGCSVAQMYVAAAAGGALGVCLGLAVAYRASIDHDLRLAAGATIVLVITGVFVLAFVARKVWDLIVARRGSGTDGAAAGEDGLAIDADGLRAVEP